MNKEIPLMLDSTLLKQVPKLNSQLFKELIKLVNIGVYKLYFSEVVEREYLTWIKEEAQKSYDNVVKATESLDKYYEEPNIFGLSLNATANIAHIQISEVLKKVVSNWEDFKKSTNTVILPIESSHGELVMNSYFSGDIPFKNVKNRSDIPDAFIYHGIKDLLKNNEKILFISRDKNFVKRINSDQVVCFENLSDLFSSEEYRIQDNFFKELEQDDKAVFLFRYFTDDIQRKAIHQIELSDFVQDIGEELENIAIGKYIEVFSTVEVITLDEKNIKTISKNSYLLPFSANVIHSVKSEANKDEVSLIIEENVRDIEKEVNDEGSFEITESIKNTFQGHLSIIFDSSDPLLWKEKVKGSGFFEEREIEEIIMNLEDIKKA